MAYISTPKRVYDNNCQKCHGDGGHGGIVDIDSSKYDLASLQNYIEEEMALYNPESCVGECADFAALHIKSWGDLYEVGKQNYEAQCSICHEPRGQSVILPIDPDSISLVELIEFITESMPDGNPEACTGECSDSIAAYIKSWTMNGDPVQGKTDYEEQYCETCHGMSGEGPVATIDAAAWEVNELAEYIEKEMPYEGAWTCFGSCAQNTAAYIKTWSE